LLIFKGKGCKIGTNTIEVNGDIIHGSEMDDHLGHRTSINDKDSMILPVSGKSLTYSCLILVVFIHLSSANYLSNIVVVFMVQIYGFSLVRDVVMFVLHGEGLSESYGIFLVELITRF
jgi:hypothetical protein